METQRDLSAHSHHLKQASKRLLSGDQGAGSERVRGSQGPSEGGGLHVQMKPEDISTCMRSSRPTRRG
ncbi:unnamed protein product [Arctogadus glacialis]